MTRKLRPRQKLGKYRVDRRIGEGGFADVYAAYDTIEGISVALKVPHDHAMEQLSLGDLRHEVRLTAGLDHPNILPLKTATYLDDLFVIVYPLGEETLADRMTRRVGTRTALAYVDQMLEALACAHEHGIVHCDVKPENFILFPGDRLRLSDFGIAKLAWGTATGGGAGTIDYMAPEQAFGRPSYRSDVFSLGLVIYQLLAGALPTWPFEWPFPNSERLRRKTTPAAVSWLRRALEVDDRRRPADVGAMRDAYRRVRPGIVGAGNRRKRRRTGPASSTAGWKRMRFREFRRIHGKDLLTRYECTACEGPMAEAMVACPWCGSDHRIHHGDTSFPASCPRCHRGVKRDWRFCPWCYGGAIGPETDRTYTDARYTGRCANPGCERRDLMPFMRYCPWCRRKVRRGWPIPGSRHRCRRCGWGVVPEHWDHCPWCAARLRRT